MNTPDEDDLASTSRAGDVADLRDDDPIVPPEREEAYEEYDEDLATVGSGGDPWATTGSMPRVGADPFGASGAFDDLRGSRGDGYDAPGGARYDDADRRHLR